MHPGHLHLPGWNSSGPLFVTPYESTTHRVSQTGGSRGGREREQEEEREGRAGGLSRGGEGMEEELPGPSRTYAGALAGDPLVAVARVRDGRRLLKQVEETFERVRLRPPRPLRPIPFLILPLHPVLARARLPPMEDRTARSSVARFCRSPRGAESLDGRRHD